MGSLKNALETTGEPIALLKVLAENSFDSILITDATVQAKIIYANKAFSKLTGYASGEVVGKAPKFLQGPATDKKVVGRLAGALKAGKKFEGRAINYKKDGTPFIMHWRVMPVRSGKKIIAWLAIQREG